MADDNNFQNRLANPTDRPTPPGQHSDPLAELARLIGQNDPFADFGREQRAKPQPQAQQAQPQPTQRPRDLAPMPPPPFPPRRDSYGAPVQNQIQQPPPAFIQAGHDQSSSYRDHDFDIAEP